MAVAGAGAGAVCTGALCAGACAVGATVAETGEDIELLVVGMMPDTLGAEGADGAWLGMGLDTGLGVVGLEVLVFGMTGVCHFAPPMMNGLGSAGFLAGGCLPLFYIFVHRKPLFHQINFSP